MFDGKKEEWNYKKQMVMNSDGDCSIDSEEECWNIIENKLFLSKSIHYLLNAETKNRSADVIRFHKKI